MISPPSCTLYHLLHPLAASKTFTAPSRTLTAPSCILAASFHTTPSRSLSNLHGTFLHPLAPSRHLTPSWHLLAPPRSRSNSSLNSISFGLVWIGSCL
ncbi:hypothetical protein M405DRAFT_324028 [Rhizopogon salebrosus TDB-379]|nr:hypothetical protein M405DRAFT_324028 [Rhizopogon salebrosus TDB-379]